MWAAGLAAAGALIGLTLALVSPRLVTGRGRLLVPTCPACGRPLNPVEVVTGRGACGHPCGGQGPLLLVGGAVLGAVAGLRLGPGAPAAFAAIFLWVLLGVSATDMSERIIPDSLLVVGGAAQLVLLLSLRWAGLASHIEGMALLFGITFLVALVSRGGLGGGDVKLAAYMGLVLGLAGGVAGFLVGGLFGGLYGVGLLVLKKKTLRDTFAFGPFLAAGAALILLLAPALAGL